jgi:hypothetical protein
MSSPTKIMLGGSERLVPRLSGHKVFTALAILREVSREMPKITQEWSNFEREYRKQNSVVLDRTQALMQFPDRLAHMTDADWEASGNKLTVGVSPSQEQTVAAVFPVAIDLAEKQVMRLMALVLASNEDIKLYRNEGTTKERLDQRANELLDADISELIELAVVAAEVVDDQVRSKIQELGQRTGKFLEMVGLKSKSGAEDGNSTSRTTSQTSQPTSSIDSIEDTDSDRVSLTNDGTSSVPSPSVSTASA